MFDCKAGKGLKHVKAVRNRVLDNDVDDGVSFKGKMNLGNYLP